MKLSLLTNVFFWIYNKSPIILASTVSVYTSLIMFDKLFTVEKKPIYEAILTTHKGIEGKPIIKTGPMYYLFTDFINEAKESLYIEAYALNSTRVIESIIKARKRGVTVMIIIDYRHSNCGSISLKRLVMEGVQVYGKMSEIRGRRGTLMHNKIMIRDENFVSLSSMDPTESALCGSFNNFIRTNDKKVVEAFLNQFKELKSESLRLTKEVLS